MSIFTHPDEKVATHSLAPGLARNSAVSDTLISDTELLSRVASHDQVALRALMHRHHARIARFIRRFINDRNLVEDLVGDTFFAVWQQAAHFENRSSVATWLLAIARYKALNARERRTLATEPLDGVAEATLVDSKPRPDAVMERDDWARFLRQCVTSLPAEQALLIELVYFRDKSIKETAHLTGLPENTVKSRMFLARKKLAAMLNAAEVADDSIPLVPSDTGAPAVVQQEHPRKSAPAKTPSLKGLAFA